MHVGILGHIAIDTIASRDFEISSLGGPPSYAGLVARRLHCDVTLVTKVGADFPDEYSLWFARNNLNFSKGSRAISHRTTRFRIYLKEDKRRLQLASRCQDLEPLQLESLEADGAILSPVVGEIPKAVSDKVVSRGIPTFLDPQGYLRRFDDNGFCYLAPLSLDELPKTSIIKADPEEGEYLTGSSNLRDMALKLRNHGFDNVIVTNGTEKVIVSSGKVSAEIKVPRVDRVLDTTGLGDILAGSSLATFLKTGDFIWSVCVGVAFASMAARGKGIAKVDDIADWEDFAEKIKEGVTRY